MIVTTDPVVELKSFPVCNHAHSFPYIITVLGKAVGIQASPRKDRSACSACMETYLNTYSTQCAICSDPILPLMQVAEGEVGGVSSIVHGKCVPPGAQSGVWGEGERVYFIEAEG